MGNPVVQREVRQLLRNIRTPVLTVIYLAVLSSVIIWMWPDQEVFSVRAQTSRSIVLVFCSVLTVLVMFYAPAFSSTSIVSERENQSFELLLNTLLKPHHLITGKLVSSLGMLYCLILFSFPFFATSFFLGAVSLSETVKIYLLITVTGTVAGLLGLSVSARAASSNRALIITYLFMLTWLLIPYVPGFILSRQAGWTEVTHMIQSLSPLAAITSVITPSLQSLGERVTPAWQTFLIVVASLGGILLLYLVATIYLPDIGRGRSHQKVIDDPKQLAKRKLQFPFYLIDPLKRRKNLSNWINPIFARELRSKVFGGGIWVFRGAYIVLAVSVLLMIMIIGNLIAFDANAIKAVALSFQIGLILLMAPALTSSSITQEYELGNVDNLRLSKLSAWTVMTGKLQVALLFILLLIVGAVPLWIVIHYMQMNTTHEILLAWSVIGATILMCLMLGMAASSLVKRSASAAAIAYLAVALIGFATLAPYLMPGKFAPSLEQSLRSMNPFLASIQILQSGKLIPEAVLWPRFLKFSLGVVAGCAVLVYLRLSWIFLPAKSQ